MAYPDPRDTGTVILGSAVPDTCVQAELGALRSMVALPDPSTRFETVSHPGQDDDTVTAAPFELQVVFFGTTSGEEEGRQLIESDGSWFVLAAVSPECEAELSR